MRGNFTKRFGETNSNYKDGRKGTRLYSIYNNMKTRCYNQHSRSYPRYGGRGISICEEWLSDFGSFKEWAGENGYADSLTIDRIDVNGNYDPSNCRWIPIQQQALNTSKNHLVEIDGETKPLTEWSRLYGINPKTVRDRLARAWDYERAIKTPPDARWVH